ncbi:MAG: TonB-dependent receptor plug domain-containing protein [Rhodospirillaceae bacterium]
MTTHRRRLATTASATALVMAAAASPAVAQAQPQQAQTDAAEEIIVTGTRVVRDGYEAPTPLTVVGIEELLQAPAENLADFVNELPSVANSTTPQGSSTSASSGTAGVNTINLRALGSSRTLVLLDGQRSVGSTLTGNVDVNNFPQMLVERVDVVTGGASAAYGSDAVSGVVNFIIDKDFTGLKASVEGGITTYGDGTNWKVSLAGGTPFANDRGHAIFSAEFADRPGIRGIKENRDWAYQGCYIINNPAYTATNGQPERLRTCGASLSQATLGGIITSAGPLQGIAFGPGGQPYRFNYGPQRLDPWMIGGEWKANQFVNRQALDPTENRTGFFTRVGYDLADNIEVFGQFSWNNTSSDGITGYQFNQGNIIIRRDNAFIPAEVLAAMPATMTQFNLGSMNGDLPLRLTDNDRTTVRYVVGLNGDFDAIDTTWSWDAYYQMGITRTHESVADITNNQRLANATDAIRHPTTGVIVCRINGDTNPANDDPACIPFNRMGIGVNSRAALDYFVDSPYRNQRFKQDVMAFSVSGEPFEGWAGPISLAFGAEHRIEQVSGRVDPAYQAGWFVGNFLPSFGKYNVTEGFIETVIPIIEEQLDLNAAVRFTDYSTSGFVTTYKAGLTWSPVPDIRFRGTYSRDIRAPNLQELFAAGSSNTNNVIDPFNNNAVIQYTGFNTGNLNLDPEKADTIGLGVVLSPSFVPGLQASIDYFNIEVAGAIGTVGAQQIVDFCFEGLQQYCAAITRGVSPGGAPIISRISISPFNLAVREARGMDFDVSYRFALSDMMDDWNGNIALRFLASHYIKNYEDDGLVAPTDTAGQNTGTNGVPSWVYRASITYDLEPFTFTLTGRGVSSGTLLNSNVECTSGCPASTASNRTINDNRLPGALYLDTNFAYDIQSYADDGMDIEVFLNIKNITNKDPAIVPQGPAGSAYGNIPTEQGTYDALGRVFRAGLRFRM